MAPINIDSMPGQSPASHFTYLLAKGKEDKEMLHKYLKIPLSEINTLASTDEYTVYMVNDLSAWPKLSDLYDDEQCCPFCKTSKVCLKTNLLTCDTE